MATLYYRPQTLETIARITLTQYDEMYLNGKPCAVPIEAIIKDCSAARGRKLMIVLQNLRRKLASCSRRKNK